MKKHKKYRSFQRRLESRIYQRKAFIWLALGIFVIVIALFSYIFWSKENKALNIKQTTDEPVNTDSVISNSKQGTQLNPVPVSFDIALPYAPQAPFSNWTVHEESCEEASLVMYHEYLGGNTLNVVLEDGPLDISYKAMKSWQVQHYGKEPDLTMTALGAFAKSYYGYTPTVQKSITSDDIKAAIAAGHPVIVPVMTHSLQNNMYGPVSVYHVLLIKGYDSTGVITNDAGVGNGQNKHYDWNILWQAIDAQTAKMGQGREMLYLTK